MIDNDDLTKVYLECLNDQILKESLGKSLLGAGLIGAASLFGQRWKS